MRVMKFKTVASQNIGTGEETDIPAIKGEGINYDAEIDQLAEAIEELNDVKADKSDVEEELTKLPTDVQVDGVSVLGDDKIAKIPRASSDTSGTMKIGNGAQLNSSGTLRATALTKANYDSANGNTFVGKTTLENIKSDVVRRALTDDTQDEWTEEDKKSARERIGLENLFELIEDFTINEETARFEKSVEPNGTPYNFSKIMFLIDVPNEGNSGAWYFECGNTPLAYGGNGSLSSNSKGYGFVEVCNGFYRAEAATSTNQFAYAAPYTYLLGRRNFFNKNTINTIKFNSTTVYPVGTRIQIYGLRA